MGNGASVMEYNWSAWSEWSPIGLVAGLEFAAVPSKPGAYVVATDRPLSRCVGVDPHGMLTIGESDDLRTRIQDFCCSATNHRSEGHMAGWRYAVFDFDHWFPYTKLRVRWRVTKTKGDASELESRMLLAYLRNHCELPPLNYNFNWQAFKKDGGAKNLDLSRG